MKKYFLFLSLGVFLAQNVKAVEIEPYVGADYVYSFADVKHDDYVENRYHALNASLGAMITSTIGAELSYQISKQNKKNSDICQTKSEYKIFGLDGVYYFSILDKIQLLGSAGLGYYEFKVKVKSGIAFDHDDENHFGLRAGLGAQYNIDNNWAARLMLKYHYIDSKAIDSITDVTLGVRYYF